MLTVEEIALQHGCKLPRYGKEARPELYNCWKDRVLLLASRAEWGVDVEQALSEADVLAGYSPSAGKGGWN